jgi:glycosyltransferase involved in cell wall biosynthesis
MSRKPFIIACIPAFNEEASIAKVVLKTQRHVDRVIVCDDGSNDMTAEIAEKLGAEVIRHERNMGKGAALKDLFRAAGEIEPDIIVVLDADGQHDPDEIPKLVEPLKNGTADLVIGSRYVKGGEMDAPLYRRFGLRMINFLTKRLAGSAVRDTQSGFRAFTFKALKELRDAESRGFGVESEQVALAVKKGLRVVEIPIRVRYKGLTRTSKKTPLLHGGEIVASLLRLVVEERPLLFLGVPGMVLMLITMALGAYLLLLFNATRYFSLPIAIIALGAGLAGMTLIIAALTLYGLNRVVSKVK